MLNTQSKTKTALLFFGILSTFLTPKSYADDHIKRSKMAGIADSASSDSMPMPMPLVAPLFLEGQGFASTVVLVNPLIQSIAVDVVVRERDGTQSVFKTVTLQPRSQLRITLASLIGNNPSTLESGSILLVPKDSRASTVAALLSVAFVGGSAPSYIDEEFAMPNPHSSALLRGVALESSRSPFIAITSVSTNPQTVSLDCLSGARRASKPIRLDPGATVVTECWANELNNDVGNLDAIVSAPNKEDRRDTFAVSLKSDGGPGMYAAFAITHDTSEKDGTQLYGPVPFFDPIAMQSPTIIFPGVPIGSISQLPGNYTPRLAVANFGAAAAKIKVVYAKSLGDPNSEPLVRTALELSLGSARTSTVPLNGLDGSPDLTDSLIVSSSGEPGDVVANLASVSSDPLMQMFVLGRDGGDSYNGGKHPWHIEGVPDSDAVLLLFNHSEQPQEFGISIGNNGVLWSKRLKLSPKRTSAISIRKLIQAKVKDDQGRTLRPELRDGEIAWSTPKSGQAKGRLLESSADPLAARSFSCTGILTMCSADWTGSPGSNVSTPVNGSVEVGTLEFWECNSGDPYTVCCNCSDGNPWYGGAQTAWQGCNHTTGCTDYGGPTNNFSGNTLGVDNITTVSTDGNCTAYDYCTVTVTPNCPTSISIAGTTPIPLENVFPGDRTGVGIVASMQVGPPSSASYNNSTISESLSVSGVMQNTCTNVNECQGGPPGTVGTSDSIYGVNFNSTNNILYDTHALVNSVSVLDAAGLNTCTYACNQTYQAVSDPNGNTCPRTNIGSFLITYTLRKDTINGTPVTRVGVTKQ